MNHHRNSNRLGELFRQLVQTGIGIVQELLGGGRRGGSSRVYQDPDIIDMPQPPAVYEIKPLTKVSGVLMTAVGGLAGGSNLLFSAVCILGSAAVGELALGMAVSAIPLLLSGGFGYLMYKGISKVRQFNRFEMYRHVIGVEELCNIRQLADSVQKSERFVVKDVEQMIRRGWFCQGHLDTRKECLMVTDHMYQEYRKLESEKNRQRLEEAEERRRKEEEAMWKSDRDRSRTRGSIWNTSGLNEISGADGSSSSEGGSLSGIPGATGMWGKRKRRSASKTARRYMNRAKLPLEVRNVLDQGDNYIEKIRDCNDAIPGEEISAKMEHMEMLLDQIFERVAQYPEKVGEIRKLMEYYLPTTVKMLETYAEMDAQRIGGENIQATKKEIEDSLDTINKAFENLFDSMFQEAAWDVSTDISVLKTMLAQEGLHDGDIKK